MPKKTVIIDGKEIGVVMVRGMPIMTLKQITFAFGLHPKVVMNIWGRDLKGKFTNDSTFIATPDDCVEAGIPVGAKMGRPPRLFNVKAIMIMRDILIKKTNENLYYDVLEQYFGYGEKVKQSIKNTWPEDYMEKHCDGIASPKPGVIFSPPEIKAKPTDEDDEILALATKIVEDRRKTNMQHNALIGVIKRLKDIISSLEDIL